MYATYFGQQNKNREKEYEKLWEDSSSPSLISLLEYPDQLSAGFRDKDTRIQN